MEIRTYTPEDWPAIRAFIDTHWRAAHPYTHQGLFDWQFRGFGQAPQPAGRMMVHEEEVVGFLGCTPGDYFADAQILRGGVFDLWVVRSEFRNRALGLLLMRAIEEEFDTTCCLGVNPNVVRFYTARGYCYADRLNRYVAPLIGESMRELLSAAGSPLESCTLDLIEPGDAIEPAEFPAPDALQQLYEQTVERVMRYGLHRSADFWRWRYLESAGFEYLCWGDPACEGVIIGRVERILSPEHPQLNRIPVLRLIELLPASVDAWLGRSNDTFMSLFNGVLNWARTQGCMLADYQCSSRRLSGVLADAGLREVGDPDAGALSAVPNLFQPLRFDAAPINYVWRIGGSLLDIEPPSPQDIYFVKSDNGMDRPNVWPLPETHRWTPDQRAKTAGSSACSRRDAMLSTER